MANIIITGSTRGIGFALAREFFKQGHSVVVSGRTDEAVTDAVKTINNNSEATAGIVIGTTCDVSVFDDVKALWDFGMDRFGTIDIWINNAGLARATWPVIEIPIKEIDAMVSTNMRGMMYGSKTALEGMIRQNSGKIFNMLGGGSDGEFYPGMGVYGATKRGVDYFTSAMVKEMKDTPIVIGKIRPGMVITEAWIREIKEDMELFHSKRKMMNALADYPETVAPFLVTKILAAEKSGTKVRWLNSWKITWRMVSSLFKKPVDKFERFGL